MTREELNPILARLGTDCATLLTERVNPAAPDALADEIINAIVTGQGSRSCPARIAARLRPQLRTWVTTMRGQHGFAPEMDGFFLRDFAGVAVYGLLYPAPRLMNVNEEF